MKAIIKDIAYHLPETLVSNDQLRRENPSWDMNMIAEKTGVYQRYIAQEKETALDLARVACQKLFGQHKNLQTQVDGLIFCTQSPDHIMPPNSCILHKYLDLSEDVMAFDLNLACSGYIYGLGLAQGLISSGLATNVLLVTGDTYSKYIHKMDRSSRVLFGDGASASWIMRSDSEQGILDIQCSTSGKYYDKFIIPAGGCRLPKSAESAVLKFDNNGNGRSLDNIHMDGMGILAFVNSKVPKQIQSILMRNALTLDDIDLFIFHQASKMALDSLIRLLKIPPEKVVQNLAEVGNTVSTSIPMCFKFAMDSGRISQGSKILLCGFGVGLSWGTVIIQM
ncbi:MAG: ketoacyl-ACP synthase III [Phycisphaerae bacterium]